MTKKCSKCRQTKDVTEFTRTTASPDGLYSQCKDCKRVADRIYGKTYKTSPKGKEAIKRYCNSPEAKETQRQHSFKHRLKKKYGLSCADYLEMFRKQNGKCAICCVSHLELNQRLSVDHNHITDEIRGLLCKCCNRMLGFARDNPIILDKARQYLEYHVDKYNKKRSILT